MTDRPTRDYNLMAHAHLVGSRATCQRLHVGALAARDGRILITGYNGAPAGLPHCEHPADAKRNDKDPCLNVVHAEANVLAYAAKWGIALDGAQLYTTNWPCHWCCMLMVNSGIQRVVCGEAFPEGRGKDMLREVGIEISFT